MRELGGGQSVACHFPLSWPAQPAAQVAGQTERS
jgi:hypothetical protein